MILNTIWEQQYNPMGNIWLSAGVAALPIVIFLISLVVFKLKGYTAGGLSILSAAIVAAVCYKMPVDKIAAVMATGAPNPAAPSKNALKENAIKRT